MAKESVEELLKQAIAASDRTTAASNRTTHAIRAFVLFIFIQLGFTTVAAFSITLGFSVNGAVGGVVFGFVFFVIGVIVSSSVGWKEIRMSGFGLGQPRWDKEEYEDGHIIEDRDYVPRKKNKASESAPEENSATRVCFKCERVYPSNVLHCSFCDLWLDPRLNFKT
jgi:hypothetical protein